MEAPIAGHFPPISSIHHQPSPCRRSDEHALSNSIAAANATKVRRVLAAVARQMLANDEPLTTRRWSARAKLATSRDVLRLMKGLRSELHVTGRS
jgi:hypothetical protein